MTDIENLLSKDYPYPQIATISLLALQIQSLIADKSMIAASANKDITCYGEWRTNYNAWHEQTDAEIQALLSQAHDQVEANQPK